jgi:hypothetical protein
VSQRLEKIAGTFRILDHAIQFAGTSAALEVMQFHTYTNKF